MNDYEEYTNTDQKWHWILIFILAFGILGICIFYMSFIDQQPREWDFGQLPDTPSESVYSTTRSETQKDTSLKQIDTLPSNDSLKVPGQK